MRPTLQRFQPPGLRIRLARFEDVAPGLRLIEAAIDRGCRAHYGADQRWAVFASYAQAMFVEVMGSFVTMVAEQDGEMVGLAQLDPSASRLRALFVHGKSQGQGHGRELLGAIEDEARARRLRRLQGAMSLNAAPFYARAGYRPCEGKRWLVHGGIAVPVIPMEKYLPRGAGW